MSTFAPDISHSLSLKDIFNNKIPAVADTDEGAMKSTEKRLISPELIAYPQVSDTCGEASTIMS